MKGISGAAAQRRKTGPMDQNRVFSRSSISYRPNVSVRDATPLARIFYQPFLTNLFCRNRQRPDQRRGRPLQHPFLHPFPARRPTLLVALATSSPRRRSCCSNRKRRIARTMGKQQRSAPRLARRESRESGLVLSAFYCILQHGHGL